MPGYYGHLMACKPNTLYNRDFELGAEIPDLLKSWKRDEGIAGAKEHYSRLRTKDMPLTNSKLFKRLEQEEVNNEPFGMHYGWSSNPNIRYFWYTDLTNEERQTPFYKGYLWHLLTDILVYTALDTDYKWQFIDANFKDKDKEAELKSLHREWDITNKALKDKFGNITLSPEVEELKVVQFVDNEPLKYLNLETLIVCIEYLRQYNPLLDDLDTIIDEVLEITDLMKKIDHDDETRALQCQNIIKNYGIKPKVFVKK